MSKKTTGGLYVAQREILNYIHMAATKWEGWGKIWIKKPGKIGDDEWNEFLQFLQNEFLQFLQEEVKTEMAKSKKKGAATKGSKKPAVKEPKK